MFFWEINNEVETFEVDNFTLHWKLNYDINNAYYDGFDDEKRTALSK